MIFFKSDTLGAQENMISRTYTCFLKDHIVGFITLVGDTIEVKAISKDDGVDAYLYAKYPAIKIARLAIDKRSERKGIGTHLLYWALGLAYSISQKIGYRYITVDSKRDSVDFYIKFGFKIVKKYRNREYPSMYLNMVPISKKMRPKQKESLDDFQF